MPSISNVFICDMPIRFDNYSGCSHGCEYCFAKMRGDISQVKIGETPSSLLKWIQRQKKEKTTSTYFEENIPIHWGGVSDPFQPIELKIKSSLACLEIFEKTQYPFVLSTKSDLITKEPYFSLIKKCNCVIQISAVSEQYDEREAGAPPYKDRIEAAKKLSSFKRVIIRHQPLIPQQKNNIIKNIGLLKEAGVYGVIIEFLKSKNRKEGLEKVQGDFCFKYEKIKPIFDEIKKEYNNQGIKVFAGENRLRQYGDDLCCCGVGDMFKTQKYNLNHLLFDNNELEDINSINIKNLFRGEDCIVISQASTRGNNLSKSLTLKEALKLAIKDKSKLSAFHITKKDYESAMSKKILL